MQNDGLSFLEITLTILIISIVATIGILKYTTNQEHALKTTLSTNLSDLRQAISLYHLKNETYPTSSQLVNQFLEGHFPINPINKNSSICVADNAQANSRTKPQDGCGWAYYQGSSTIRPIIYAASNYQFSDGVSANNL